MITRRLSPNEQLLVRPGSVFVWDESETDIKRWTDGKRWSGSRVKEGFLTYAEMEWKTSASGRNSDVYEEIGAGASKYFQAKPGGLVKKTLSIKTATGTRLHLISYYILRFDNSSLLRPTRDPRLRHLAPTEATYPEFPTIVSALSGTLRPPILSTQDMPPDVFKSGLGLQSAPSNRGYEYRPLLASPIVTPPTPSQSSHEYSLAVTGSYSQRHSDSVAPSIIQPPLLSPSPHRNLQGSWHVSSDGTIDSNSATSQSQNCIGIPQLLHATDCLAVLGCEDRNTGRTRSRSLEDGRSEPVSSFAPQRRKSWAEDQRAIAALDQKFRF